MSMMFGGNGDAEGGDGGFYGGGSYSSDSYGYNPQYGGNMGGSMGPATVPSGSTFDNEPPLLEELGINFSHIMGKTLAVLVPFRKTGNDLHVNDDDLAGPLIFGVLLGCFLLLVRENEDSNIERRWKGQHLPAFPLAFWPRSLIVFGRRHKLSISSLANHFAI